MIIEIHFVVAQGLPKQNFPYSYYSYDQFTFLIKTKNEEIRKKFIVKNHDLISLLLNKHSVSFDSLFFKEEIYSYNSVRQIDKKINTKLNQYDFSHIKLCYDCSDQNKASELRIYFFNTIAKEAKCECDKLYKFYKKDGLDDFTPYMSCSYKDGLLLLVFMTGDPTGSLMKLFPNVTRQEISNNRFR